MTEATLIHPGDELPRALSLGHLSEVELVQISSHLGDCPACCHRIDQLATDDDLLTRLQQSRSQPRASAGRPGPRAAQQFVPSASGRRRARRSSAETGQGSLDSGIVNDSAVQTGRDRRRPRASQKS